MRNPEMRWVHLELVEARSLDHEDTKKREARETRGARSDRAFAFATFVLRAFAAFRTFAVQTSPTTINQIQTHSNAFRETSSGYVLRVTRYVFASRLFDPATI